MSVCQHFGTCGGCRLQNLDYDEQLEGKQQLVESLFPDHSSLPILPCASPWAYRNKMEFSFSQSLKGERFLGLMMRGKRGRVVNLEECLLVSPWFIETLSTVRNWWEGSGLDAYHPPSDRGHLRTLTLREGIRTGEKMAMLTVSGNPDFAADVDDFAEGVEADSVLVRKQIIQKKVPTRFEERLIRGKDHITEILYGDEAKEFRFKIRPSSFFQPNSAQAELLYLRALELAQVEGSLLDLYCGTGTIGMFASTRASSVVGIELSPQAVADARENLTQNQIKNMEVREGDVGALLADLSAETVIVDPPRAGLSKEAIAHLLTLRPKKLCYISCHPASQARDIQKLEGYRITAIQPVDQFPHTPHIENIVALEQAI